MFKKVFSRMALIFVSIAGILLNDLTTMESFADWNVAVETCANYSEFLDENNTFYNADGTVVLDVTNVSEGFIRVRYSGENDTIRVLITKDSLESYPYWISKYDEFETFILAFGDGNYEISVYEKSHDDYYSQIFAQNIDVTIDNPDSPFLHPNFFVDYEENSVVVRIAASFYLNAANEKDFINDVYNFVKNYSYDYDKNAQISADNCLYKPNLNDVQANEKGICFDYASVMVAMLRSQGVPAKLEFGYVDGTYHSWVNAYVSETSETEGSWELYDPTFVSTSNIYAVKKLMSDPANYNALYIN